MAPYLRHSSHATELSGERKLSGTDGSPLARGPTRSNWSRNESIGQDLSVHKDSFSNPATNRHHEEVVVVDWPKMRKFITWTEQRPISPCLMPLWQLNRLNGHGTPKFDRTPPHIPELDAITATKTIEWTWPPKS
ncbi:hypothetical protein AVEN_252973-1 [Araneus ventricosus]|uniref:Uncharacterized protein n=1 Tax=Araneus ventricosus TaxID=182803 RepID=A0A4Y2T1A3_ARAVE|nr:hypothetical protein AVEN_252973-1 [Araneus ventricosus]